MGFLLIVRFKGMYQPSIVIVPLWLIFIYQFLLLAAHRRAMVKAFVAQDILENPEHQLSVRRMFALGHRFDMKVLSMVVGIPMIIGTVVLYFTSHIALGLAIVMFVLCLVLNGIIVGNFYYFKTYNNYYDIFMFGLVEDDTQAVLKNIYEDYPIIRLVLGVLLSALLPAYFCYQAIHLNWFAFDALWLQIILSVVSVLCIALAARGAIRSKPLGRGQAQVSSLSILNKMVPDGVTAMSWAFTDRKAQISFDVVTAEQGKALLRRMGEIEDFHVTTPKNNYLAQEKPHVVFALMESFGNNILIHDHAEHNDLLGRLRPYWQKGFVFERFCSDYDGTAPSLANIFFHSDIQNISQTIAQHTSLGETPFEVYKAQGYKTVFITAGNMMWRNLANYFPLQAVDELYDQNNMMEIFPEAKASLSYWGVADEYAFALAQKLLEESKEPLFISILTMTNHPPYKVPAHYHLKPLQPACLQGRYGNEDTERLAVLGTYQYACDALGGFLQAIDKKDTQARQIVVAATGDHHFRGVYVEQPKEIFLAKSVPFFVYLSSDLQAQLDLSFDKNRVASHKDIMPTLYHLSLSQATYWHGCGRSLFSTEQRFEFAYNEKSLFATAEGVMDLGAQPCIAYPWSSSESGWKVEVNSRPLTASEQDKALAFQDFIRWQINYLVTQAQS